MSTILLALLCQFHAPYEYLPHPGGDTSMWKENDWSDSFKTNGQRELLLPDGSRVDLVQTGVAWEVEWSDKVNEGIGQALQYHLQTGHSPGLWVLLRKDSHDEDYLRAIAIVTSLRDHGYDFHLKFQRTW